MAGRIAITFIVAVNDRDILENNFLASPCLRAPHEHQILLQENFESAGKAYNEGIEKSANDLLVFCHQDVVLPSSWTEQVARSIDSLDAQGIRWGVLGIYGRTAEEGGRQEWGHVYSPSRGVVGQPLGVPAPVQTLDELALIFRKSSGLKFDEALPHFHFYGTDICLMARAKGMENFSIPAWCIHNTQLYRTYPKEFYECYRYMRRKWRAYLPVQTSCIRITDREWPFYRLRLRELYVRWSGRQTRVTRVRDGRAILQDAESKEAQAQRRSKPDVRADS